jgi:uncharacterized protein (TIGR03437 family)
VANSYRLAALVGFACVELFAQPGIGQNGVVNAASQIPPTLAGGAIARGALFTIRGVRLAGQTSVTISGLPLKILRLEPRKIDVLMPMSAPLGSGSLVVTVDGRASKAFPIEVAAVNPGIFSRNGEGWGPGRVENADGSDNSAANPAHPGQRVSLASTGMGGAREAGVVVGNRTAKARVAIRGAGEERIAFEVPADAPSGCWVPVYLQAAPNRASNVVTMSIRHGSGRCDAWPVPLWSTEKTVFVALSRTRMKSARADKPDLVNDEATIEILDPSQEQLLSRTVLLPPPGTCTTSTSSYQADTDLSLSLRYLSAPGGRGLDAGTALTLRRDAPAGGEARDVGQLWRDPGQYRAKLGVSGLQTKRPLPALFLESGAYRLEGSGGADVGAFSITFSIPAPIEWINRDETSILNRGSGVTLRWKKGPSDQLILILARNVDQLTTAIGRCLCTERADAGQFTIPAALLANVPASIGAPGKRYDELALVSLSAKPGTIHAKGLNGGMVFTICDSGRLVEFR